MALTQAAEELERTKRIINDELDMIDDLQKMPRRKGLFERIVDFFKEKVLHKATYVREEQLGAQIINTPETTNVQPKAAKTEKQAEAELSQDEMITDIIPEHKNMKIFALRDNAALKNSIDAITSKDRSYLNLPDTHHLVKVEKVPIEYTRDDGTMVKASGYSMSVYNEQGQMIGTIPEKGKEALNLQEVKDVLTNKGFVTPITGREFKSALDEREFSKANVDRTVKEVFEKLDNPYIEKMSYHGVDISFNDKRDIEFSHHVMSKTMGEITITNNPKDKAKSYEYLAKQISEGIESDLSSKEPPHVEVTINKDKLIGDMTKYLESDKDSHIRLTDQAKVVWNAKENTIQLNIERDGEIKTITDPAKIHKFVQAGVRQDGISMKTLHTLDEITHKTQHTKQANLTKKLETAVKDKVERTTSTPNKDHER